MPNGFICLQQAPSRQWQGSTIAQPNKCALKNHVTTKAKTRNVVPVSYERVQVECYSGYKASERPIAFTHNGVRLEIQEIIDRWCEGGVDPGRPAADYFKVKTTNGEIFMLRYLSLFDAWSVRI